MMDRRTLIFAALSAVALAAPGAAQFDPRGSFSAGEARDRREDGERLPVARLRAIVRRAYPGCDIINDEIFKDSRGEPVSYRARIVTREGRLMNITVDPGSGRITRAN
ncbi:MAG: hypothetical protein PVI23_10615 [Maricaulaceae bacterium]|jgi:hypothetical protein